MKRGSKQAMYELQRAEWVSAVRYRRDKQEELARAIASEHEAARRTVEALESIKK